MSSRIRKNNIIQVFENQSLGIGYENKFSERHFDVLVKYNDVHRNKFFTVGHRKIIFNQYVGVIQVKDLVIEILPKADNQENSKEKWRKALLAMLHECRLIKLESLTDAYLKLRSSSLVDLYFDAFLNEVTKLVGHGLSKKYRKVQSNLHTLKGKLVLQEHVTKNSIHKERFFSEYHIYDKNHLLNQILLTALNILISLTNKPELLAKANNLMLYFEQVKETPINETSFIKVRFDRNTDRAKPAIKLAELIILHYAPELKGGKEDVLAILFDMNKLYENFVYRKLKKIEGKYPGMIVREQVRKKFWERRGLKPDILVQIQKRPERPTIVIDTKWKILKEYKPSDEDLKQMFIYNLYYNSNLSILLYPKVDLEDDKKKPFHKIEEIKKEHCCQLAFVELFDKEDKLRDNLGEIIFEQLIKKELFSTVNQ